MKPVDNVRQTRWTACKPLNIVDDNMAHKAALRLEGLLARLKVTVIKGSMMMNEIMNMGNMMMNETMEDAA